MPPPPNSYGKILAPKGLVLGGGAFGRRLELDGLVRVEPSWMGLVLRVRRRLCISGSVVCPVRMFGVRILQPGGGPSPEPECSATDFGLLDSRTVGNKYPVFISWPVYGLLL